MDTQNYVIFNNSITKNEINESSILTNYTKFIYTNNMND